MSVIDDIAEPLVSKPQILRRPSDSSACLFERFSDYLVLKIVHSFLKCFPFVGCLRVVMFGAEDRTRLNASF
jgi:hypothetical protein